MDIFKLWRNLFETVTQIHRSLIRNRPERFSCKQFTLFVCIVATQSTRLSNKSCNLITSDKNHSISECDRIKDQHRRHWWQQYQLLSEMEMLLVMVIGCECLSQSHAIIWNEFFSAKLWWHLQSEYESLKIDLIVTIVFILIEFELNCIVLYWVDMTSV